MKRSIGARRLSLMKERSQISSEKYEGGKKVVTSVHGGAGK